MKKYAAEMTGTFAIVFCGTGAIIINQHTGGAVTHAGIAVTFGLIVMAMVYALGDISGAHLNPAVSIAFVIAKRLPANQLLPYIVSQLSGGLLASVVLRLMFPGNELLGATFPAGSVFQSFALELVLGFLLMLVIANVTAGGKERRTSAGLAIGAVVAMGAMFAGPICGASMNPARSFAPAIVSGHLQNLWIYLTAPVIGASSAIPYWKYLARPQAHAKD